MLRLLAHPLDDRHESFHCRGAVTHGCNSIVNRTVGKLSARLEHQRPRHAHKGIAAHIYRTHDAFSVYQ